jgi:ribosome maturation factor RimP
MAFDLTEKRYVKETSLEARISRIIEPVANDLGYSLVRVKMLQENGLTLQIMAEDENGRFTITDCEALSKEVSPALDVEDPIDREYHLEVSSPGIDRPLVRARDFATYIGHEAKIELSDLLNGRRRFRGFIKAVDADTVTVTLPDVPKDTDPDFKLPLHLLAEAKLVMTDKLMNMAQIDQEEFPIDEDEDIETVELPEDAANDEGDMDDVPEAGTAEDTADQQNSKETN